MSALSLIIGIIVGAAVASAAWFAVGAAKRKKLEEQKRVKEEVMTSIGELLADADAYEASYRCGTLTADRFSRGLIDRVNAISRPIRTNMHILDVFFVKYAEQQVDEYMRMIENPERRAEARKAIHAAVSDGGEETAPRPETRLGIAPIAVTPITARQEESVPDYEEQDIFDAGIGQEETFTPSPDSETGADEDVFEASKVESAPPATEPEIVFEDAEAEEETPPEEQVFGESPTPESGESANGAWLDKSLEEFEAGFARFEEQGAAEEEPITPEVAEIGAEYARFEEQEVTAEEPSAAEEVEFEAEIALFDEQVVTAEKSTVSEEVEAGAGQSEPIAEFGRETGDFAVSGSTETSEPAAEEHEPESEPEPEFESEQESEPEDEEEDVFDIQALPPADSERTETQQFDKPEALAEPAPAVAEHDGITGDDVSNAIDNFFKIK